MLRFLAIASITLVSSAAFAWGTYGQDQQVQSYQRSNGTYVESYHRTTPDSTTSNNYSTQGNTNPYTGQAGHHHDSRPGW